MNFTNSSIHRKRNVLYQLVKLITKLLKTEVVNRAKSINILMRIRNHATKLTASKDMELAVSENASFVTNLKNVTLGSK